MSQNDKLLRDKGLPVLTEDERKELRRKWQNETWDDMILSLAQYGKYIMLRPTGFGKTYTCACACYIGENATIWKNSTYDRALERIWREDKSELKNEIYKKIISLCNHPDVKDSDFEVRLHDGTPIHDKKLASICKKKVIFVYPSEILQMTFAEQIEELKKKKNFSKDRILIENGRILYTTYAMVQAHWGDIKYLNDTVHIDEVGLVIFDEVQRLGAKNTAKALKTAIEVLEKKKIYYIGATATVERVHGHDVCDTYFRVGEPNIKIDKKNNPKLGGATKNSPVFCWGEHIYTLSDCFESGLLIPPEYQFIEENEETLSEARHTRQDVLNKLKAFYASGNKVGQKAWFEDSKDLENAVIKNSSKIIHDTMLQLYDCDPKFITNKEELDDAEFKSIEFPEKLPDYMRFLVFAPNSDSIHKKAVDEETGIEYDSLYDRTINDFEKAFGRYGFKIRPLIVTSLTSQERNNVRKLDAHNNIQVNKIAGKNKKVSKPGLKTQKDIQVISEKQLNSKEVLQKTPMVIDLIFSINMLNVGYHVPHITGLILKRYTKSNQVYYQQLGRCLSVDSPNIPVVFDCVNSIKSKGILAPLYSVDRKTKIVTENADGTKNVQYNDEIREDSIRKNICFIEAKYITVGMTSATVTDILERANVYKMRLNSVGFFKDSYNTYSKLIDIRNKKLVTPVRDIPSLSDTMRYQILLKCKSEGRIISKDELEFVTENFKQYLFWLQANNKEVYMDYEAFDNYITHKKTGTAPKMYLVNEINSLLTICKTKDSKAKESAKIKLLVNSNQLQSYQANTEVQQLLAERGFNEQTDLITY